MFSIRQLRAPLEYGEAQRVFVAGMTGCGKTTLVHEYLENRENVIVYDWKGTMKTTLWRGYERVTTLKALVKKGENNKRYKRLLYAPIAQELNWDYYEAFFKWCFMRAPEKGGFLQSVYIDEATAVSEGNSIPEYYRALLTRGRDRGIEVISSSQRPTGIPQWILSESEYHFVFRLQMRQDREKMGETISLADEEDESSQAQRRARDRILKTLPKREFFFWTLDLDTPVGPLKLNLGVNPPARPDGLTPEKGADAKAA
jgi:hypothetical protein